MRNLSLLLLSIITCLTSACNKDDDGPDNLYGLPDATQTGENTFGCLIDGEPWVAEVRGFTPSLHEITSNYDEANFGIADNFYFFVSTNYSISSKDSARYETFSIRLTPIYSEGELDLAQLSQQEATFYQDLINVNGSFKAYELDPLFNNYFNITALDTAANVCAAEFALQLISTSNFDTLQITDGRFDVKYQAD